MWFNFRVFFSLKKYFIALLLVSVQFVGLGQNEKFLTLNEEIQNLELKYEKNKSNIEILSELVLKLNLNSHYAKSESLLKNYERDFIAKEPRNNADLNLNYAITYKFQGENGKAIWRFFKARDEFKKQKDYEGLVNCGAEIIEFYRKIAKFEEAKKTYFSYHYLAKKKGLKNPKLFIKLYNRFSAVVNERNQPRLSIRYSLKAIAEAKKINDQNAIAISFNEMGFSYKNLNSIDSSLFFYELAEEKWMKLGYYRDAVHAKLNRYVLMAHNGMVTCQEQIDKGIEILNFIEKNKVDYQKSLIYTHIRNAYLFCMRDYKNTFKYEQLYNKALNEENAKMNEAMMFNSQEKYQNEKLLEKNKNIEMRSIQKQLELQRARNRIFFIVIILSIVFISLLALFVFWLRLKKTNKLLKIRNEQKTILVQEIHHRVKNNLQFVRSMIEMQKTVNENNSEADIIDISRRIDAMSLVHEMLYIENEKMFVSVKDYIDRLMGLSSNFYNDGRDFKIKCEIDELNLATDKIVSIGMICTELLTNSVKHAFPSQKSPEFEIKLKLRNDTVELIVSDNGIENNENLKSNRSSLGMRLIDIFSRQLGGQYSINKENGYVYSISFKI